MIGLSLRNLMPPLVSVALLQVGLWSFFLVLSSLGHGDDAGSTEA